MTFQEFWLELMILKFGENLMSLKASRTPSKIDDILGILAGVDDDFDFPDWGCCPWWHFAWSAHALRKLCLKFSGNPMSLKASRTPSKKNDISGILAGVDDDFDVPGVFDDIMDGVQMSWGSYV